MIKEQIDIKVYNEHSIDREESVEESGVLFNGM